jgi:hypothetical protein
VWADFNGQSHINFPQRQKKLELYTSFTTHHAMLTQNLLNNLGVWQRVLGNKMQVVTFEG